MVNRLQAQTAVGKGSIPRMGRLPEPGVLTGSEENSCKCSIVTTFLKTLFYQYENLLIKHDCTKWASRDWSGSRCVSVCPGGVISAPSVLLHM
jgi:hypothetical protein